jgi:hypothetical protein
VGGKPGAPSFGYFSRQDEKSDLLSGNPDGVGLAERSCFDKLSTNG